MVLPASTSSLGHLPSPQVIIPAASPGQSRWSLLTENWWTFEMVATNGHAAREWVPNPASHRGTVIATFPAAEALQPQNASRRRFGASRVQLQLQRVGRCPRRGEGRSGSLRSAPAGFTCDNARSVDDPPGTPAGQPRTPAKGRLALSPVDANLKLTRLFSTCPRARVPGPGRHSRGSRAGWAIVIECSAGG
jgi:hypothetical protein